MLNLSLRLDRPQFRDNRTYLTVAKQRNRRRQPQHLQSFTEPSIPQRKVIKVRKIDAGSKPPSTTATRTLAIRLDNENRRTTNQGQRIMVSLEIYMIIATIAASHRIGSPMCDQGQVLSAPSKWGVSNSSWTGDHGRDCAGSSYFYSYNTRST
ncbi:unnamed protein product [Soboliphyme baturini]|uniref:Uncharacterized protein n=1 Tax=Soboliphyme baturini TaxID=241478 RepID=A0A183IKY8_9BILA|nr:unnamed protein product [Soboliphyme baturini]